LEVDDFEDHPFGFSLFLNDGKSPPLHLRATTLEEKQSWVDALAQLCIIATRFHDVQKLRILGVGGQGIVYEVYNKALDIRCAMKEIQITNDTQMKSALAEVSMLKDIVEHVAHPNIMEIKKIIHFGHKFYLVFPLCTGGELLEHIIRQRHFKEENALQILHDIISALQALHEHNILHLDVKPENILFESTEPNAKIKITDFGLSRLFDNSSSIKQQQTPSSMPCESVLAEKRKQFVDLGVYASESIQGTIGYMSPELILTGYVCTATDVFAAGVVFYIMLCGDRPFASRSNRQTFMKTVMGTYRMTGPEWNKVSQETKELVKRMLEVDPTKRINTNEILSLPFVRKYDSSDFEPSSPTRVESTQDLSKLKQLVKKMQAEKMVRGMNMLNQQPKRSSGVNAKAVLGSDESIPDFASELAAQYLTSVESTDSLLTGSLKVKTNPWSNENVRQGLVSGLILLLLNEIFTYII